jgi:hypothetical protein
MVSTVVLVLVVAVVVESCCIPPELIDNDCSCCCSVEDDNVASVGSLPPRGLSSKVISFDCDTVPGLSFVVSIVLARFLAGLSGFDPVIESSSSVVVAAGESTSCGNKLSTDQLTSTDCQVSESYSSSRGSSSSSSSGG